MKHVLAIVFLLLQSLIGLGQEFVIATGECLLSGKEYWDAVAIATDNAKQEALNKTCGVDVSTFTLIRTTNDNTRYNSKVLNNSRGVVRVMDKNIESDGRIVRVTISGEVYSVSSNKVIDVQNVKGVYGPKDNITFNVSFYKPSYLKIFWIDEENGDGGILYNGQTYFDATGYSNKFPLNSSDNYKKKICPWLRTPQDKLDEFSYSGKLASQRIPDHLMPQPGNASGGKWTVVGKKAVISQTEKHVTLIFVTTDNNIPFNGSKVNENELMAWWCSLPLSERGMPEKRTITLKM